MTQHYLFHEPGNIPGVPGQFAHSLVSVADDGTLTVVPLAQQPHEPQVVNTDQQPHNVAPAAQDAPEAGATPAAQEAAPAVPVQAEVAATPESKESEEA